MTIEEAISILTKDRALCLFNPLTGDVGPLNEDCRMSAEAMNLAIEALEKQIPKKVVKGKDLFWEYQCPNTNCDTQFARHASYEFCPGCGQAIDWSEYK